MKHYAIGLDFTASTTLPVDADGIPLCFRPAYETNPHALVKLWKHHGAQRQADDMTRIARETSQPWLAAYGGKISCEWAFPKLWELVEEAPDLYAAMDEWMEAGDWMVLQLTGKRPRSRTCRPRADAGHHRHLHGSVCIGRAGDACDYSRYVRRRKGRRAPWL